MAEISQLKSGIGEIVQARIKSESLISRKGSQLSVKDQLGNGEKFVHAAICCAIADELAKQGSSAAIWGVASAVSIEPWVKGWSPKGDAAKAIWSAICSAFNSADAVNAAYSNATGRIGRFIDQRLHTRYNCWVSVNWLLLHDGGSNAYLICDGVASKTLSNDNGSKEVEEFGTVIIHALVNASGMPQRMHTTFLRFRGDEDDFEGPDEVEEESGWWWPF